MKKEDIRKTRTRRSLKKALSQLLTKKSIEQLSVIDICEVAEINRVTFYSHYKDKYELLYDLLTDLINFIEEASANYLDKNRTDDPIRDYANTMSHAVYKICFENRKVLQSIGKQENSIFMKMLEDIIIKNGLKKFVNLDKKLTLKYPPEFILKFIIGGFSHLIFGWGLKEDIPEAEFFKHFDELLYSVLKNNIFYATTE